MDLVTGAMGNLAPKLLQLLQDEYKLQTGVREQVWSLSVELESVHAILRKVAEVPWDQLDEKVKVWAREVREASYDMEDILDTFLVRVQGREPTDQGRLKRALKKMGDLFSKGKARRDIAELRATGRYKVDENLARGELISMLSYQRGDDVPEKKMKKVSIVGAEGLGKTTLAKAVYDKLKGDFNYGAFVPVGRNPDINKVFKDMLYELDKGKYENIHNTREGNQLIDLLREFLENKRYFIVIDDIWELQSWETIKLALVENNYGSTIITTTHNDEVANGTGEVYQLQPLSSTAEVDEAEAALWNKTDVHPNRPTLEVDRYNEEEHAEKASNDLQQDTPTIPGETSSELVDDVKSVIVQQTVKDLNDLQQGTPTTTGETSSEVVQRSQELYAPTVREDSRYMELNILERIVDGIEEPSHLEFPLLQRITENFSNNTQIGSGGCGVVYKGILRNGAVAVKKLYKRQTITDKMFHREVKSLITVNHQNIVRFLGYCSFTVEHAMPWNGEIIMVDIRERMLCLEYISNGSLESHCTDEMRGLEWHTRYQIIMGICKGLLYLHKEKGIVHMDLKPANILLDDDMVPKITDFGLSRLDNTSQATTTTRRVSPGYCAPEYISQGKMSSKSDIYSLGKIIMELVTGSKEEPDITKVLRRWRHRWIKSLKYTPLVYQQVKECLDLALRCMQHNPKARPDISDIIDELNKIESSDMTIQTIPCLDDMLGIEPLEVNFPFAHDQQMSCSIQLANNTDDYIAFMLTKANLRQGDSSAFMNTKANLRQFQTQPNKGIVPPQSKCSVTVTMPAQDKALLQNHYRGELTVQSTRIDGSLGAMDITGDVFIEEEGKVVDEVNVMVVFGTPPLPK